LEHSSHGDVEPAENSRVREALIRLHVAAKTGRIDSAQLRGRINHSQMPGMEHKNIDHSQMQH
jgi:hypothetical protein